MNWLPWKWHVVMRRKTSDVYMDRWQLLKTGLLSIYVNHIRLPDEDEWLHTHPWRKSWSLKLWGWYDQEVPHPRESRWTRFAWRIISRPKRWSRIPDQHRIVSISPGGCWTLLIGWRSDCPWGFVDPKTGEMVSWRERAVMRGMPERAFSGGQNSRLKS